MPLQEGTCGETRERRSPPTLLPRQAWTSDKTPYVTRGPPSTPTCTPSLAGVNQSVENNGNLLLHNEGGNATWRRGASLSGLPLVPFRRHDLAAFILNPILCARRKLFEGPAERRGLLHGGVPCPFVWHGFYAAVFSTTDTKSHRFLLSQCCCTHARYHIPSDVVVNQYALDVETNLPVDLLLLHNLWTMFRRC